MGFWRVTGSTQLQNLAVRKYFYNSAPSGDKLVGILNRMGMKFASKLHGTLVAQPYWAASNCCPGKKGKEKEKLCRQRKLGIDLLRSTKLARELHAHSVQYAQTRTSTGCTIEIKNTLPNSGAQGLHASRNPPDPR
eukprot:1139561-Pelagomonas_calceolata.AAC.1